MQNSGIVIGSQEHKELFCRAFIDTHDPTGVNGGYTSSGDAPMTVVYAEVDDVQAYLDRVVAAGGSVHTPVTVVPEVVTYAVFTDPFGVRFGLIQRRED